MILKTSKIVRRTFPLLCVSMLSGCFVTEIRYDLSNISTWEAKLKPALVCQNDRVNLEYRFPVTVSDTNLRLVTAQCDSSVHDCALFYPALTIAPTSLFPMPRYNLGNYEGRLQSEPLTSVGSVAVTASVTGNPRSYSSNETSAFLTTPSPNIRIIDVTRSAQLNVNSIALGGSSSGPVLFNGQCAGGVASWTPVALEVGEARSSGVKLRQICNRESLRSVMFIATYNTGFVENLSETSVLPGSCIRVAEAVPYIIRTIAAVPSQDPTAVGPQCANSAGSAPPAPVRAEFTYGCDGG